MKLFQKFLLDGEEKGDKQARNQNLFLPRRPVINLIWLTSSKAKYLQMHTVNIYLTSWSLLVKQEIIHSHS